MNVRKFAILRGKSFFGRILRQPFRLIPSTAILPILFGVLKGKRWIKGSHNLSILFGTYEKKQSNEFCRQAAHITVFWDLGAHAGYYSLLFNAVNKAGRIYAFEPVPGNCKLFDDHMRLNSVERYTLFAKAVSDIAGTLTFSSGKASVAGKLSHGGDKVVEVVKLSDCLTSGIVDIPGLIKMDIEGEELKVLKDLTPWLTSDHPKLFLSTHGERTHNECVEFLRKIDYRLRPLDANSLSDCRELFAF